MSLQHLLYSALFLVLCCTQVCAEFQEIPVSVDQANPDVINSFADCVAAGRPIQRTHPARCVGPDGTLYTQSTDSEEGADQTCVSHCGDGQCAEMVCQAIGCPCPETKESCPQDCG